MWNENKLTNMALGIYVPPSVLPYLVLNQTPAAGVRDTDDGARMVSEISFDTNGKPIVGLYRKFYQAGQFSTFSRIMLRIEPDLSTATATDIDPYQAGTTSVGWDPGFMAAAAAGEWAPVPAFDYYGTEAIWVDNSKRNTVGTHYWRTLASTDSGASFSATNNSSNSTYYQTIPYNAGISGLFASARWVHIPGLRANSITVPTAGQVYWMELNTGVTDTLEANYPNYASLQPYPNSSHTPFDYTLKSMRKTRDRSDCYFWTIKAKDDTGTGLKDRWFCATFGRNGAGYNFNGELIDFTSLFNGYSSAAATIDPGFAVAYWKHPTLSETNDVLVYCLRDESNSFRIGRRDINGNPVMNTTTDLNGATYLEPNSTARPVIFSATGTGVNAIEMCSDYTTKSRVFLVRQMVDDEMIMTYSDDGGATWSAQYSLAGASTIWNYANGLTDNRSQFFIASYEPTTLYVMALSTIADGTGGKTEWVMAKWTDPAA